MSAPNTLISGVNCALVSVRSGPQIILTMILSADRVFDTEAYPNVIVWGVGRSHFSNCQGQIINGGRITTVTIHNYSSDLNRSIGHNKNRT